MKRLTYGIVAVVMVAAGAAVLSSQGGGSAPRALPQAEYDQWKKELSNWGRWGANDELGTLNLITPAKRKQAAALVKEGFSVSLARDAETEKAADNANPYQHVMQGIGSDRIAVAFHGQAHTHMDALAHIFDEKQFGNKAYNGYAPTEEEVKKAGGHAKNSIYNVKNGIFTRGVLIDIPRLKGVPYLEPGESIFVADLEAWEKKAGVKVGSGDALFVRTGRWARRAKLGAWDTGSGPSGKRAGLDPSVVRWLRQRDVAVLSLDIPQSVNPGGPSAPDFHVAHNFPVVILGMHLIDNSDLEALSEAAAARNRWEFLLTVAPLPIRGGTGSPVNPVATF